jgi:hypothetical protein
MKKNLVPFQSNPFRHSVLGRLSPLIGGLLLSSAVANAEVHLTFDTDTQGVIPGGDAASMLWDAYGGGCLAITVGTGWKPSGAFVNLNDDVHADPAPALLTALRAELQQALINGGTMSYKITVETDAFAPAGPFPGWCQTIYQGRSWAGWDQSLGGTPTAGQLSVGFNNAVLPAKVEYIVNYTIEAAQANVNNDSIAQFRGDSQERAIHLGLNTQDVGGQVRYYIDDFKIDANEVVAPVIIPNVKITPAVPGLTIISSGFGQYDRQCVRTPQGHDVSWVGGTFPKTYEFTIADYPPNQGYESVIYFIPVPATPPGTEIPATNSNPDYSMPVAAGAWIYPNGDGTGTMNFRYKVGPAESNGPAGNEFWIADPAPSHGLGGQLAGVGSTKFLGTWKVTFTSDTDFTLTAPDGATATGAFNPTAAALFAGPMHVYFGNVPGTAANIGLAATYSRIKITGTVNPVDEELSVNPYSSDLEVAASAPAAVVQVLPDDAKYWLHWTMPATDFQPMQSMDLGLTDPWVALPPGTAHNSKFGRTRLLLESELSSPTRNFIRLVRPGTP